MNLDITTPHGTCATQLFTPEGRGPWPAVIVCFDAFGVRPSMIEIATRIAASGYDEARATLTEALRAAHVTHTVETYPGRHGFAVRDNPAYDTACAERHYAAMVSFFGEALKG
jgi:dienelactone hydrolase